MTSNPTETMETASDSLADSPVPPSSTSTSITAAPSPASPALTNSSIQIIGQGGFGCVYYRGFDSTGKIMSPIYVTKLAILETNQETEIGKLISHLPGYDAFFNTVVETQPIDLAVLSPETKEQCKVIKRFAEKNPGVEPEFQILKQLYVPHVTLLDFVKRRGIFMDAAQTYHVHTIDRASHVVNRGINAVTYSVPRFVNTMINCYEHVLMAIARMQAEAEVVHYDIKIQNVVLNVYTKTPIILDFGLSFSIRDVRAVLDEGGGVSDFEKVLRLKTFFYGYHADYAPWAIETHIISFLVNEAHAIARNTDGGDGSASAMAVPVLTVENLTDMLTAFVEGSEYLREQPEPVKRAYFNRAIRMYTQSAVGKPGMQVIRNYIFGEDGNAWRKWEIYSAATLILDMMEEMNKAYKPFEIEPYKKEIDAFCTSLKIDGNYI